MVVSYAGVDIPVALRQKRAQGQEPISRISAREAGKAGKDRTQSALRTQERRAEEEFRRL